jgi:DNA-binding NarL/FixJ family response regulator
MRTTIVLADDHELVGKSIAALLRTEPDFDVIAECRNGREMVKLVQQLRPNVAIVDIAMPGMNGVEVTQRLRVVSPGTRVIVLTNYTDEAYVRGTLNGGAVGYIVKSGAAHDLIQAIREGSRGKIFLSEEVRTIAQGACLSGSARPIVKSSRGHTLSPREREVLQLIVEGSSTKRIAAVLGISNSTVKDHRRHIKEKLGIRDVAGLTRYAISIGMIRADPGQRPRDF